MKFWAAKTVAPIVVHINSFSFIGSAIVMAFEKHFECPVISTSNQEINTFLRAEIWPYLSPAIDSSISTSKTHEIQKNHPQDLCISWQHICATPPINMHPENS